MRRKTLCFAFAFALTAAAFLLPELPAFAVTEKTLHSFSAFPHGDQPTGLVADAAGNFYGTAQGGSYNQGIVYRLVADSQGKVTQTILYNFTGGLDGGNPGGVVPDGKGNLYGFASLGGLHNDGTFFRLSPAKGSEWSLIVLYNFSEARSNPFFSGPCTDGKGNFFTAGDFALPPGSIAEFSQSGNGVWSENIIYTFSGGADGGNPGTPCVFDSAGNLFGTASTGGGSNGGVVYKLTHSADGAWTESVLHNFSGGGDGDYPQTGLTADSAGNLYGLTGYGGNTNCGEHLGCGTAFKMTRSSNGHWTESVLYRFSDGKPLNSLGPSNLAIDAAGNLYGSTYAGGTDNNCYAGCGTVFQLSPTENGEWTQNVLTNFTAEPGGYNPSGGMVFGAGGRLYGTTTLGGLAGGFNGTVFEATPNPNGSWTVTTPFAFPTTDGDDSQSTLIEDAEGNLYGTTALGGLSNIGTVFKLSPTSGAWKEQLLFTFVGSYYSAATGSFPEAGVIMDSAGNLYGTTVDGGSSNAGLVFELSPTVSGVWNQTVLYSFTGGSDGGNPFAALIFDSAGNLYGTTEYGGVYSDGTVFKLSPGASGTWTESVIHSFAGYPADGSYPAASLVFDSKGNLYGTTSTGGSSANCLVKKKPAGCGTVFEMSPTGNGKWSESLLYSFTNSNGDGAFPFANLIFDSAGNLYGTTEQGGVSGKCQYSGLSTCGTIFQLTPGVVGGWTEKVLYAFKGFKSDGAFPLAGLVMDSSGNLYGTTDVGGNASNAQYDLGFGTVFELSPTSGGEWTESVLHNFQMESDGGFPQSGLLLDGSGNFFGATAGDAYTGSVVYELTP
jgi:uncharacterized repeat protein (TIGR03803 family)